MGSKILKVVVPLANDANKDWTSVGENFAKRAAKVVGLYYNLRSMDFRTVMAQGAGTPSVHSGKGTLATLGARHIEQVYSATVEICNESDEYAVGTYAEMRWIVEKVLAQYPACTVHFHFVSQQRHLARARFIANHFLPTERCQYYYVLSDQTKEISWLHEARSYATLMLIYLGLGDVVRAVRRRYILNADKA